MLSTSPGMEALNAPTAEKQKAASCLFKISAAAFMARKDSLQKEVFGPCSIIVEFDNQRQLLEILPELDGQLTASLISEIEDHRSCRDLIEKLESRVGRLILNGYPTGVEVCDAMIHGGPFPATSDSRSSSVGTIAIDRYLRPVCYQGYPDELLPEALKNANQLNLRRLVNGEWSSREIEL